MKTDYINFRRFWIGLSDEYNNNNNFTWISNDNGQITYRNFAKYEPFSVIYVYVF